MIALQIIINKLFYLNKLLLCKAAKYQCSKLEVLWVS